MAIPTPIIRIGDLDFEAADNLVISRSLDTHAGTFTWRSPDYQNPQAAGSPLQALFSGRRVRIVLEDDVVFTGYPETLAPVSSRNSHYVDISGRSLTADLVDSSAPAISESIGQDTEISLGAAISRANDGIGVVRYQNAELEQSKIIDALPALTERVSAYIDRMAQQLQCVTTDTEFGELYIYKPVIGRTEATLEYGDGILLEGSATFSTASAYSDYILIGIHTYRAE